MASYKFHRKRDQRQALLKSLAESLILQGTLETTLPKAKAAARYTEKLVSKAKKGKENLHARRAVISALSTYETAHRLVDEIAPEIDRQSGYFRVKRTRIRQGDGAQLASVSFVDKFEKTKSADTAQPAKAAAAKDDDKKEPANVQRAQPASKQDKTPAKTPTAAVPAKRTGIRGNR